MKFLFNLIFYRPLYNALVFLTAIIPGGDLGFAIILLTLAVKLILFPFQHKMSKTQRKLKLLEAELKQIKEKHAADRQKQAEATMALYRAHGINPLSGFGLLLIQIPILLALFWVFNSGFSFDSTLLYPFVKAPATIHTQFLGLIDLTAKSLVLALIVGITQFFQARLALPIAPKPEPGAKPSFQTDLARSMSLQTRYILPIFIAVIAYTLPSAISLYWITSNLFGIGHELWVRRQAKSLVPSAGATN